MSDDCQSWVVPTITCEILDTVENVCLFVDDIEDFFTVDKDLEIVVIMVLDLSDDDGAVSVSGELSVLVVTVVCISVNGRTDVKSCGPVVEPDSWGSIAISSMVTMVRSVHDISPSVDDIDRFDEERNSPSPGQLPNAFDQSVLLQHSECYS